MVRTGEMGKEDDSKLSNRSQKSHSLPWDIAHIVFHFLSLMTALFVALLCFFSLSFRTRCFVVTLSKSAFFSEYAHSLTMRSEKVYDRLLLNVRYCGK
jgi:hypothetical protein